MRFQSDSGVPRKRFVTFRALFIIATLIFRPLHDICVTLRLLHICSKISRNNFVTFCSLFIIATSVFRIHSGSFRIHLGSSRNTIVVFRSFFSFFATILQIFRRPLFQIFAFG
uniref:Uncharacterized protein n=1 Tax=Cacopsylla melanoneura TaxID=428564 RepID=A0A8D9ECE0_9HEMI